MAALELSAALNAANAEFDVRVDSTLASTSAEGRRYVYSVEVLHLRPVVMVQA